MVGLLLEVILMKTYKLYVTDLTGAYHLVKNEGFNCQPKNTYLEVQAKPENKLSLIKLLNKAHIVMLDIEVAN